MSKEAKAAASPEPSEDTPQPAVKEAKPAAEPESVYSVDELTKAAGMFDTTPDIVRTALRMEGVTEATINEAKRIVRKFKKREVQ